MTSLWKRSLSLLLAFAMVIGMMPMNVIAAEVDEWLEDEVSEEVVFEEEVVEEPLEEWDEPLDEEPELEPEVEAVPEDFSFEEVTDEEDAVNAEVEEFEEITDSDEAMDAVYTGEEGWNTENSVYTSHGTPSNTKLQTLANEFMDNMHPASVSINFGGRIGTQSISWGMLTSKSASITESNGVYTVTATVKANYIVTTGTATITIGTFSISVFDTLTVKTIKDGVTTSTSANHYRDGEKVTVSVPTYTNYNVTVEGATLTDGEWVAAGEGLSGDKEVTLTYTLDTDSTVKVNEGNFTVTYPGTVAANGLATVSATPAAGYYIESMTLSGGKWNENEISYTTGGIATHTFTAAASKTAYEVTVVAKPILVLGEKKVSHFDIITYDTLMKNIFAVINTEESASVVDSYASDITVKYLYDGMLSNEWKELSADNFGEFATNWKQQTLTSRKIEVIYKGNEDVKYNSATTGEITVSLYDGRQTVTITPPTDAEVTVTANDNGVEAAAKAATTVSSGNLTVTPTWEKTAGTMPTAAAPEQTYTYKVTVAADQDNLGAEATVNIKVKLAQYEIGWDTDADGDVDQTDDVYYGATPTPPTAVEKDGYSAVWPAISPATANATYTVGYSLDDIYTFTYVTDVGEAIEPDKYNVTKNPTIVTVAPTVADVDNWIFIGWYTDEALTKEFTFGSVPTASTTLYAKWEADTWNNNVRDHLETATIVLDITGPGSVSLTPAEGVTLNEVNDTTYTLVFNTNDDATKVVGITATPSDSTNNDNNGELGYVANDVPATITVVNGTNTVKAVFDTHTLNANNGTISVNKYYAALSNEQVLATLRTDVLTKAGLKVEDKYKVTASVGYEGSTGILSADAVIYDGSITTSHWLGQSIVTGATALALSGETMDFTITDTETNVSKKVTMTIKDTRSTLDIQPKVSKYTIRDKGPVDLAAAKNILLDQFTITVTDPDGNESELAMSADYITISGYKWPEDAKTSDPFTVEVQVESSPNATYTNYPSATLTLTCVDTTIQYTVTYLDGFSGAKVDEYIISENLATTQPADPNRNEYYTFAGWIPAVEPTVTGDATYTATWTPKTDNNGNGTDDHEETYTVIYKDEGEDGQVYKTVADLAYEAATPTIEDPKKTDWFFAGWNPTVAEKVTAPTSGNTITYTATWSNDCTIIFKNGDDETKVTAKVNDVFGVDIQKPADPTKDQEVFLGWFEENATEAFDFTAPIKDSVTLYARWADDKDEDGEVDGSDKDPYWTVTIDKQDGTEPTVEKNVLNGESYKTPEAINKDYAIFVKWDKVVDETNHTITFTAVWNTNDANNNDVDDNAETVAITIVKANEDDKIAVGCEGELVDEAKGLWLYDSTMLEGGKLTITATPVVESGISSTWVKSVTVDGVAAELAYGANYVATATIPMSNPINPIDEDATTQYPAIVVTFAVAEFEYNEERLLNYYDGMPNVKNDEVYNAIVKNPELTDDAEYTIQYKAREAMSQTVQLSSLGLNDTILGILKLMGIEDFTFDMPDLWLDVNVETEGKVKDSVSLDQAVSQYLTTDKINGLWNLYEETAKANGGLVFGADAGYEAVKGEIDTIYNNVYNAAMYYGAHNFGYNATGAETVTEEIKITYKNGAMYIVGESDITLKDLRATSIIDASDVSVMYRDYTDEELAALINATVVDENGVAIEGAQATCLDITDPYTYEGKYVSETAYELTFKFGGNETYKPSEKVVSVTVTKATITEFDAPNVIVTYGDAYDVTPIMTLGNKFGEEKEVVDSLVRFVIGLDVADVDIDGNGIKGLDTRVQLMLTEDLQSMLDGLLGLTGGDTSDGMVMSLNELMGYLESIDESSLGSLKQALEAIQGIMETTEISIIIGGEYPTDVGAYLHGAVTTSTNYETAFDVGYILIKPDAERVYLDWNYNDTNGIYTPELLKHVNLGASAYAEETFATLNSEATAQINNLFFGIDINGELVAELFNKDITDPEVLENSLDNGAYTQLAFIAEFGNEMYYAVPIVRAFAIIPNTVTVEVVGMNGDHNREILKTFTGGEQGLDVRVTDLNGNVLFDSHYQGEVNNLPEGAELTVVYKGLQTNTQTYDLTQTFKAGEGYKLTKPVHAGAYAVAVTYVEKDAEGKILAVGADAGVIAIQPSQSTITMEEVVIKTFTNESFNLAETMKIEAKSVNGDENYITDPDYTVISAAIASTDDFTVNGWDAVTGRINIDFPVWMDEIIAKYAPSIQDGITVSELKDKLIAKLPDIAAKMAELGATEEMINSLSNLTGSLSAALDQLPGDVEINFTHDLSVNAVGVYAVMAVVTDSDHYPSADVGVLAIVPDVTQVDLKWNYEDDNMIWTRELLRHADLWAKAFNEDGTLNESATLDITYLFVGVDKNGELIVKTSDNVEDLPNGAYLEAAYIELEVNGQMVVSDLIARPLAIVPGTAKVVFVDENGNENADRRFTFDGKEKQMKAVVSINGEIIEPAEGTLTVTYAGAQTNSVVTKETYGPTTEAPKHAGVYTVVASYIDKNTGGSLEHIGGAVGVMAIEPAESTIAVNGYAGADAITYDGEAHTVDVIVNNGESKADFTLISGHVGVDANIDQLGVDAFTANVHVEFPVWLYNALVETEAVSEGVNGAYLADFISSYKDELLSKIPVDVLVELGVEQASIDAVIEKLSSYIDELTAVLAKLPENVGITFSDNTEIAAYTEPGYYGYYGIVTDSDYYPSADTGLLVINKLDMRLDMLDTTVPYDGNGHEVDVDNELNADYVSMIVDRETNTVNFRLGADAQYMVSLLERVLEVDLDETSISTIYENVDVAAMAEALTKIITELEALDMPEEHAKALAAVKAQLADLPADGTIVINGELPVNAGAYEFYGFAYSEHYKTQFTEAVLTIAPVYVVVDDNEGQGKTYGDADPALTAAVSYYSYAGNQVDGVEKVTITELPDSDIGLDYEVTRAQGENVGEYALSVTASIDESENYVLLAEDIIADDVFTITQAELTIELHDVTMVYGTEPQPALTYTITGLINNDVVQDTEADLNLKVVREDGNDVGEYAITATAENPNYSITIEQPATFTITAREITSVALKDDASWTYNGSNQAPTKDNLIVMADGIKLESDEYTLDVTEQTNAGTYSLTVTAASENFSGEKSTEWTIEKAEIVRAEVTSTHTYSGEKQTATVLVYSADDKTVNATEYTLSGNKATDAGDYTVTVTSNDSNYFIAEGEEITADWTIAKREVTIVVGNYSKTYGEDDPAFTYKVMEGDTDVTDEIDFTVLVSRHPTDDTVGEYSMVIGIVGTTSNNYIIGTTAGTFTIEPAVIDKVVVNNGPFTYDGTEQTATVTVYSGENEVASGEYTVSGNTGTDAAEYTVTVTPVENGNYIIKDGGVSTTWTINKAAVTVTADAKTITYGDAQPEYTSTVAPELFGQDALAITYKITVEAGEDVTDAAKLDAGTYTITPVVAEHKNYNVTAVNSTLTVNKKAITAADVKLGDALTYNGAEQTQTVVKSDAASDVTFSVTGNTGTNVAAEGYTLIVTGTGNYTGTVEMPWNIQPKDLADADVKAEPKTELTYNGKPQKQDVTVTYTVGETVLTLAETTDYTLTNNEQTNVKNDGKYTLTVTGTGNYTGTKTVEWNIAKAQLKDVALEKPEYSYTGSTITPVITEVTAGENGELKLDTTDYELVSGGAQINLGEYKLVVKAKDNTNYTGEAEETWEIVELTEEDAVCWNPAGNNGEGKYYSDLSDALEDVDDAAEETIVMLKDYTENYVIVAPGTTLDLDGFTVDAYLVVGFKDSHVIDSSDDNSGLLKTPVQENVRLDIANSQVPAWNGEGYKFFEIAFKTALQYTEATDTDLFRFFVDRTKDWQDLYTLFADTGAADHNLAVKVKLNYVTADGINASISYAYPEFMVITAAQGQLGSATAAGIYKCTTVGMSSRESITYSVVLESGTGVAMEHVRVN